MIQQYSTPVQEGTTQRVGLSDYATLHWWMMVPMVAMQLGIFRDYWGDFSENAWSVHVHYWTGTIWYLYLIVQPYLATRNFLPSHRTNGIIGMFIAGGVCLTAFSMMSRDLANAARADQMRDQFGPFEGWFFMGVAAIELIMMAAFGYAVIMSIIHRKKIQDHAWWLMTTVFIIMMPALGRGIQNVYVAMNRSDWPNVDIVFPIYITNIIIIALIVIAAWRYRKLTHKATWLALAVNAFNFFLEPLGRSTWVRDTLNSLIKP